ncbi:TonB-dependent receptor [Agaribacterium haliotis]|uniref:TonB-dependent receptor n=1 Tax=Agaribacterium haliotis TaxID=2013869 RepID=UPI001178A0DC|nr:TonB-dependent receptor [Agaribacterium haliotis]
MLRKRSSHTLKQARLALLPLAIASSVALAQLNDKNYHIEDQALGKALNQLSQQSEQIIIAPGDLVSGKLSPKVEGHMSLEQALDTMLKNSGLQYRSDSSGAIIIEKSTQAAKNQQQAVQQPAVETMIVNGRYSASLNRSLESKREANTVVEVISSTDIGKFPTENVAEALQVVPGVQISRNRGEGLFVSVRGLGPDFQVAQLNGRNIAINENVENSGQQGRSFRFDVLASDHIAGIEVIKAPEARHDEGAIGGIINVKTFRPSDLGKTNALTAKISHSDFADTTDPRISGLTSWTNTSESFGALFSAAYSQRHIRQDRAFTFNWIKGQLQDQNGDDSYKDIYAPQRNRPTLEQQDRERVSASLSLEWQPTDNYRGNIDTFWSNYTVDFDEIGLDLGINGNASDAIISGDSMLAAKASNTGIQLSRETSKAAHENLSIGTDNQWLLDRWTLDLNLSYSNAESNTDEPIRRTRLRTFDELSFDYRAGYESGPDLSTPVDLLDPASFPGRRIEYRPINVQDSDSSIRFDALYELEGLFTGLRTGFSYRERSRDYKRQDIRVSLDNRIFDLSYFDAFPVSDFLSETDGNFPREFLVPNSDKFFDEYFTEQYASQPINDNDRRRSYKVDEDISAVYAQGDFDSDNSTLPFYGNLGLRYVKTVQKPSGLQLIDGVGKEVSFTNSYYDPLPSLNVNFRLQDNLLLRSAAAKVISRPALNQLTPGLSVNTDSPTAQGGNPLLNPYKALQYDASIEWYFDDSALLSTGVFYKDIQTFISSVSKSVVIGGEDIVLSAPLNTGEGSISGFEFNYQQVFSKLAYPMNGLGLQFNYTYANGSVEVNEDDILVEQDIGGLSENSFNLIAFYEIGNFASRIGYNWRDKYLLDNGVGIVSDETQAAFGTVDASISYDINDIFSVSLEGVNITNAQQKTYFDDENRGGRIDTYGSRYIVAIRSKF